MQMLVVGAGGIGGYFGGRLAAAGRDVTFLVRATRYERLTETGLRISSPLGDVHIARPQLVTAANLQSTFDVILLSCKAYNLEDAIASITPAVGGGTALLPLLNGIAHLERLEARFGAETVLGGTCFISTTVGQDGAIVHMNDTHRLTVGERSSGSSSRILKIGDYLSGAGFEAVVSSGIMREMWNKFVFIAASAGMTCLMRSSIGDYVAGGATDLALALLEECAGVAADAGYALDASALRDVRSYVTAAGSTVTTSMLRDIESNRPTEGDHIIGDMLGRAHRSGRPAPVLDTVYAHLKTYERRRTMPSAR